MGNNQKKILLIMPLSYQYYIDIINSLNVKGYDVDYIPDFDESFLKRSIRYINKSCIDIIQNKYIRRKIAHYSDIYDYVFIFRGYSFSFDSISYMKDKFKKYMQKTMLSISTKLTEYMMNSKLIIAYGPEKVASMRLVYENNLGLFIEANETKKEIFDKVKKVFVDDDLRNNYISNAYNYVNKNFTEDIISSRLYNDINSLFSNE
jgi:DNA-directed RNA polymerase beta' subunit